METPAVIALASKHVHEGKMPTSAQLCLDDALALEQAGRVNLAKARALHSLSYSIGILHQDYQSAAR